MRSRWAQAHTSLRSICRQEIRFIANEHYFAGKPQVERFIYKTTEGDTFQFLETGEQDFASFAATQDNLEKLQRLGFVNLQLNTSSAYGYIAFNHAKPYLKDKRFAKHSSMDWIARRSLKACRKAPLKSPMCRSLLPPGLIRKRASTRTTMIRTKRSSCWRKPAGKPGLKASGKRRAKAGHPLSVLQEQNSDAFIAIAKENYEAIGINSSRSSSPTSTRCGPRSRAEITISPASRRQ